MLQIKRTVTRTGVVELTDSQIREALTKYARTHGCRGDVTDVVLRPDNSWEAEGKKMFNATLTFTTTETEAS